MTLQEGEILEILTSPRNPNIKQWKIDHEVWSIYVNGGDVASELEKIQNYENDGQKRLREKVARSTKDVVSNLLNPISKVFNASGGSVNLEDLATTEETKLNELIDELPEGMSLRVWMETYWKDAFVSDPNGVVLVEVDEEGRAYPTYKNIANIHDYTLTWNTFDYLVLKDRKVDIDGAKDVQVYRVIDDSFDALYYVKNDKLYEFETDEEAHAVENTIGEVPAVVCGGIVDKETGGKKPFIHIIDEALKEYLRSSSVHTIYKFLHLFPKFWSYAMKCTTCQGTGQVDNTDKTGKVVCPTCNGSRLKKATDVSDGIYLPLPKGDQPVLGGNIAGYIDTPEKVWIQQNEDLEDMLRNMEKTIWGSYLDQRDSTNDKTATEAVLNVQAINENLCAISRCAESKETQILNYMTRIVSGLEDVNVSVMYGKRFIIENPDALWNKYLEAKEKGSPVTTLDYHYEQYLMSEYQNNIGMLNVRKAIFSIEPFPHYSITDLVDIATPKQMQRKILFSEWIANADLTQSPEKLKANFEEYATSNTQELQTKTTD